MQKPPKSAKPAFVLRRCDRCKKFHASYRVEDPHLGVVYLCYDCWKKDQERQAGRSAAS